MDKIAVISIIYREPEWINTERCLDLCRAPVFFVDRKGVGSLAKAINSGFRKWGQGFEYIWFVTNIQFDKRCLPALVNEMDRGKWSALTPTFHSDHDFCRPGFHRAGSAEVPFVEFTAAIVRSETFSKIDLDEGMPYWGHDLDWGYRVRQSGGRLGVMYDQTIGHVYIRHNRTGNTFTKRRMALRRQTDSSTRAALVAKYGQEWKKILYYG